MDRLKLNNLFYFYIKLYTWSTYMYCCTFEGVPVAHTGFGTISTIRFLLLYSLCFLRIPADFL